MLLLLFSLGGGARGDDDLPVIVVAGGIVEAKTRGTGFGMLKSELLGDMEAIEDGVGGVAGIEGEESGVVMPSFLSECGNKSGLRGGRTGDDPEGCDRCFVDAGVLGGGSDALVLGGPILDAIPPSLVMDVMDLRFCDAAVRAPT